MNLPLFTMMQSEWCSSALADTQAKKPPCSLSLPPSLPVISVLHLIKAQHEISLLVLSVSLHTGVFPFLCPALFLLRPPGERGPRAAHMVPGEGVPRSNHFRGRETASFNHVLMRQHRSNMGGQSWSQCCGRDVLWAPPCPETAGKISGDHPWS